MWVVPDTASVRPAYMELDINGELAKGGLVPVASGQGHDAAISIRQDGAVLWAGRLKAGEKVRLPDAPFLHVFTAIGDVELEGTGRLAAGDAARVTRTEGLSITAGPHGAEVLVWEMHKLIKFG